MGNYISFVPVTLLCADGSPVWHLEGKSYVVTAPLTPCGCCHVWVVLFQLMTSWMALEFSMQPLGKGAFLAGMPGPCASFRFHQQIPFPSKLFSVEPGCGKWKKQTPLGGSGKTSYAALQELASWEQLSPFHGSLCRGSQ